MAPSHLGHSWEKVLAQETPPARSSTAISRWVSDYRPGMSSPKGSAAAPAAVWDYDQLGSVRRDVFGG